MKKYIDFLNETRIYNIKELSKFFGNMGFDDDGVEIFNQILSQEYKRLGDQGVMKYFKSATGQNIYAISHGKYVFEKV